MSIAGLDHVPMVVEDLAVAEARFEALLGVAPAWRGRIAGVAHAFFEVPGFALDVLAPEGDGPAAEQARGRLAKHGPGASALGFRVADLDAGLRTLERRGLPSAGSGVTVSTAADASERRWPIAMLRTRSTAGLPMFLVEGAAQAPAAMTVRPGAVTGLDHVVINTDDPERAVALYAGRLGLDLRLDRTHEAFGARMLFFRCGGSVVEVAAPLNGAPSGARDRIGGLAWRTEDVQAARERLAGAGFDVSGVRSGRKPGTSVFTVRDAPAGVPTLFIGAA